jgi:glycosyltransferase involved in cell wall biosynthesis
MSTGRDAIAVAIHDGFYGCGTGAGHSNRAFLQVLARLLDPAVRLVVLPITLAPASREYDPAWHEETAALIRQAQAGVVPVDNGTLGATRFGGLPGFRRASASAAATVTQIIGESRRVLVIAFDVPFFGLAPLLSPHARASVVNVARATAMLHAPGDEERAGWERAGLLATTCDGGRVAAISGFMRQHLAMAYGVPPASIIALTNGLTPNEQDQGQHAELPADSLLPPIARGGFMLAYGRAEPYKGWDDLLGALRILKARRRALPHVIAAAVTDGAAGLSPYQARLARTITEGQLDVTLLTSYDLQIRALLRHPALAAVVVPSRAEPFGRIPLEAFAAGASPVIATTAGGLAETVTEGHTGYTATPADPKSLAAAISRALAGSDAEHARMLTNARVLISERYDYTANVRAFLAAVAPWAVASRQSA